ncbi:MAG: DUF805 domain-containing protein [Rhodobacteraceae bacterium]|nr:DUF805 domain-containing protein [Paracoccaceae bacterium]
MTPVRATLSGFRSYATFSGRAGRAEYAWFLFAVFLVAIAAAAADRAIWGPDAAGFLPDMPVWWRFRFDTGVKGGPLTDAWAVLTAVPLLAVTFRRLHDTGRPGWHALVPGAIASLAAGYVLWSLAGHPGGIHEPEDLEAWMDGFGLVRLFGLALLALGASVWLVVNLVRRTGTLPNRYGPPVAEAAA